MTKQTNSKKAKRLSTLQSLLQQHKDKFQTLQNGKIKCLVTGHEFLPSQQNLQNHLKSKSFKKATEAQFDISEYEGILETHKQNENFLFCKLTGAKVPKKKTAIEKHVNGKRFKARFEEYKKLQEEGEQEDQEIDEEQDEQIEEQENDEEQQEEAEQEQEQEQEEQVVQPKSKAGNKKQPQQNGNKNSHHSNNKKKAIHKEKKNQKKRN